VTDDARPLTLADLQTCFAGLVPAVLATVSATGVPNVTYLSRAHPIDDERIALSNQFFSKSSRNLAENPHASLFLVRPDTHEEFRLSVVFEQTMRRGPVFERLRNDLSMIAALTGMQEVFRLHAADVYRVTDIARVVLNDRARDPLVDPTDALQPDHAALGELCARLSRCSDLDTLVRVTVDGLAELLGYDHSMLLLVDETGERLFTIASHGYPEQGVGAEVGMGEGIAGLAAQRCTPIRAQNLSQMTKYSRTVRTSFERSGDLGPGVEVPMPGLAVAGSQLAVPALTLGQLVGAVLIESPHPDRFTDADTGALNVVSSLVASTVESLRAAVRTAHAPPAPGAPTAAPASRAPLHVRHFVADASTFLDTEYLIKGVAGRIFWSLLRHYDRDGRTDFTNREVRLDPSLDLPDFRDNFESRLILLKRRLDERDAPVRIEKTARGRFRLVVHAQLRLEAVTSTSQ
jgi:predicted pyridoxine 5'-phosphate oxidase superfamily flavin-nucleotide-binding protein